MGLLTKDHSAFKWLTHQKIWVNIAKMQLNFPDGPDTTADLIRETEEIEKRLKEATNLRSSAPTSLQPSLPTTTQTKTVTIETATDSEPVVATDGRKIEEKNDERVEGTLHFTFVGNGCRNSRPVIVNNIISLLNSEGMQ